MNLKLNRLVGLALGMAWGMNLALGQAVDFESQIKPLLSDRCFACHGPDENARKADLHLYSREGAMEVITQGNPSESELFKRLVTTDPDDLMPPPDSNLSLTAEEKDLIRRWIAEGAEWKEHWAFAPVKQPTLPKPAKANWAKNEIDQFTLTKMTEAKVAPSPAANREKLIRRLSFDLTGLPPSLAEIDRFVNDDSPNAYEKIVDRLLGHPRFGEHLAVHWLDLARYSDTYGYQVDRNRHVWPWRDWVIRAFNDNLPTTIFSLGNSPATCCPTRPTTSGWPPRSTGCIRKRSRAAVCRKSFALSTSPIEITPSARRCLASRSSAPVATTINTTQSRRRSTTSSSRFSTPSTSPDCTLTSRLPFPRQRY